MGIFRSLIYDINVIDEASNPLPWPWHTEDCEVKVFKHFHVAFGVGQWRESQLQNNLQKAVVIAGHCLPAALQWEKNMVFKPWYIGALFKIERYSRALLVHGGHPQFVKSTDGKTVDENGQLYIDQKLEAWPFIPFFKGFPGCMCYWLVCIVF